MRIHRVKISGFKVMGTGFEIEFPDNGKIGIWGKNESGKSTLLESIEYALYGIRQGASVGGTREDIVTWGKNEGYLELEFGVAENRYLIQRRITSKGHKAKMLQSSNGEFDPNSQITSIGGIQAKIEELTGMDRDTFSKLVYIKQKDLDALKDLQKASREQLVNKVIGIEVFDRTAQQLKEDLASIKSKLQLSNTEFENIKKNKETYELENERFGQITKTLEEADRQKKLVDEEFRDLQEQLAKYEWSKEYSSKIDLLSATERELKTTLSSIGEVSKIENENKLHRELLDHITPLIVKPREAKEKLTTISIKREDTSRRRKELETRASNISSQNRLSKDQFMNLVDIRTKKRLMLTRSLALIGLGAPLSVAGLFLIWPLLLGLPLLAFGIYLMMKYLELDRLSMIGTETEVLSRQLSEVQEQERYWEGQLKQVAEEFGFDSPESASAEIEKITNMIKAKTGQETVDGLKGVTQELERRLKALDIRALESKRDKLEESLRMAQQNLKDHETKRPSNELVLDYDQEEHDRISKAFESKRAHADKLSTALTENRGKLGEIQRNLEHLKPDFERYPKAKSEIEELELQKSVAERTLIELSETSRGIRSRVIPQAKFIINQILPGMTDGRYTDFDITEDLKFKVHSMEAGGYKEREVFSGGTQDQFLIALRLAFTQSILDSRVHSDTYFLLMDECVSSSDESRKSGIFEVLEAMKDTFSQILVVAHEDISNLVDNYLVLERDEDGHTTIRSKSW